MTNNLKMLSNGEYVYRTALTGQCTKVHVYYTKGGMNPFSGGRTQRGVYVSICPIELKSNGDLPQYEIQSITQGIRACLMTCGRMSQKAIDQVAEKIDAVIPAIAGEFSDDNRIGPIKKLVAIFEPAIVPASV